QDAVVALLPALQAIEYVLLRGARLEAEEGVGEVVADRVQLGWKIVRLRFTLLTDLGCLLVVLVHVVRDGAEVVEELAVDRPPFVLLPDRRPDEALALGLDGVGKGEGALAALDDVTEPLVLLTVLVGGGGGGSEPALVDAAAVGAEVIDVLRRQLQPPAGHQEGARHPGGGEA